MSLLSPRREVIEFRKRYKWMVLFVVSAMIAIVLRLFTLQVIQYDRWAGEANRNITKVVRLPATRGLIRDYKGRVIADNRPSYNVFVTPRLMGEPQIEAISGLLELDAEGRASFRSFLARVPDRRRAHFVQAFSDISRDQYAAIETHRNELPGTRVVIAPLRSYPNRSLGAHTVGFLNQVNAEDLKQLGSLGYGPGDSVGRGGIERAWESYLRGRDGELRVAVDSRGRELEAGIEPTKGMRKEPVPGLDLRLTLDMDMMRSAERAFRPYPSGAVVVVDVHTGRVRALYSKPGYDLNELASGLSHARAKELLEDPYRPLIDKTTYESYFPGSTFKPISALAALQDSILPSSTHYECPGSYMLGKRRFRCSHTHKDVDMREALEQSCNVYFYKIAELAGIDRIASYAREFGLGQPTGIGINTEASGFVPTREWYMNNHDGHFHPGFALNTSIGQGDTRVTLIQLALVYATLANGGTLYIPQLVEKVEQADGSVVQEFQPRVRRQVPIDAAYLTFVRDSLYGVVNHRKGTAYEARIEGGVAVAGKTGTAEVSKRKLGPEDSAEAWRDLRAHSWFAAFAPAENPELAIVVLVEHGGTGGKFAAPVATQVLQDALGGEASARLRSVLASKKP